MIRVTVSRVTIPAWSTVGYGTGVDEEGRAARFMGDHRPMRDLGEAVEAGEEPEVELEAWQLLPGGEK